MRGISSCLLEHSCSSNIDRSSPVMMKMQFLQIAWVVKNAWQCFLLSKALTSWPARQCMACCSHLGRAWTAPNKGAILLVAMKRIPFHSAIFGQLGGWEKSCLDAPTAETTINFDGEIFVASGRKMQQQNWQSHCFCLSDSTCTNSTMLPLSMIPCVNCPSDRAHHIASSSVSIFRMGGMFELAIWNGKNNEVKQEPEDAHSWES